MNKPMGQLAVVELLGSAAGGYAGRLFAGWGSQVTLARLKADDTRPEGPAAERFLDPAKRTVTVDRAGLDRLIADADVVIESSSPQPLRPAAEPRSGLVRVRISPLGDQGPHSRRWSTELTDQARSGHLLLNGDPGREPISGPPLQVSFAAGLHGFIGAIAALVGPAPRHGGTVDVNHLAVMASLHQFTLVRWLNGGDLLRRMGNRWAGPGQPCGLYRCHDGFVSIIVPRDDQLERLLAVADLLHLLEAPGIDHAYDLMHHPTMLDEHLRPWFATQPLGPLVELLQNVRVPAAPVSTMADLLEDAHLAARDSLVESGGVRLPGAPARIDDWTWRTAPPGALPTPPAAPTHRAGPDGHTDRPLAGLRVVDLSRVWAGPLATRILSDLGADVIMVEAPWARGGPSIDASSVAATRFYPDNDPGDDHWNRTGFVNKYALGKRSIALDLSDDEGRDALAELVTTADVVIENFSPRVMPQLGFDQQRLRELNPDLIYVTMPGYGRSGPDRDRVAYGPIVDAHAGLATLMGYRDEPARSAGVAWPDPVAGMHAAAATLVAVLDRRAGSPCGVVEVAQIEATINMVGAALARYQLEPTMSMPRGNDDPNRRLQAVVRCRGNDRWVAISILTESALQHLRTTVESTDGPSDGTNGLRRSLESWCRDRDQHEVVEALSVDGAAVAAVADAEQLRHDPQLAAAEAWATSNHPSTGEEVWPRTPIRLDGQVLSPVRPAPLLGQHNRLLVDECGVSTSTFDRLVDTGRLTTVPPA